MKNIGNNYQRFRELWAVPRYKSMFKLGGWLVFFVIFFILLSLSGARSPGEPSENKDTGIPFGRMKSDFAAANHQIEYHIIGEIEYFIEGTLIDDIISGTLEIEEETNRIKITADEVYIVRNRNEIESDILDELNLSFLFPKQIIEIINDNLSIMRNEEESIIHIFDIAGKTISVYTNEEAIYKIIIVDDLITYELKLNIIN